ncbi:hypothetical protein THMIRHAS_14780 [Thiosulfatimonas sediminis]|uniref:Uncharacterized protein n=1 Tax=Thiosulfatimonas sediminis TaxID=2675054 RepID=A0A6F8PVF5_9GAMM|nr:hypothetical protein [Thiosulfatimonas sediminis]BBP46105.1 hypothetical protein THMIRHAS_14780 [Thiosulfatimonas sediminis]
MLKYLTLLAIIYFFFWLIKHKVRQRKLEAQGYKIEAQQGLRPVTILSIVLLVIYGGYLLYYVLRGGDV